MTIPALALSSLESAKDSRAPLCVDLDGTLVRTNLLLEAFLVLLKTRPLAALLFPLWLLRGRAYAKDQIARRVSLDARLLPYNAELLAYLREQRDLGRELILATAAHRKFAKGVADHLGIFQQVLATDDETNLKGVRKLGELRRYLNGRSFSYAGDAFADLPIWEQSSAAILVNPPSLLWRKLRRRRVEIERVFRNATSPLAAFVRATRPHQWTKNLLLFVPLFLAHKVSDASLVAQAAAAFASFTLCAAGVYILNDLFDLEADRAHPSKRRRPLPLAIFR